MADEDHEQETETPERWEPEKSDPVLEILIKSLDEKAELGVTLAVEGQIITGKLINIVHYYSLLAEQARRDGGDDGLTKVFEMFRDQAKEREAEDDEDRPPPSFIHLKDAAYYTGELRVPTHGGVPWRGRLGAVSGFSFGIVSQDPVP